MKISQRHRYLFSEAVALLYVMLFVYAAVSKLADFENFQVQLGQSPLLSAFADLLAWAVPALELVIALLLVSRRGRLAGLFGAFSLMAMFTAYIFIILNCSPFVPCSCGGILENMGWKEHFIFNAVFMMLAAAGILYRPGGAPNALLFSRPAALASAIALTFVFSIGTIALLFVLSEDIIHKRNNFVRRFPHHPAEFARDVKLDNSSSYIAGASQGKLYMGNYSDPLLVTEIDAASGSIKKHRISLEGPARRYRAVRLYVDAPYFYLSDGTQSYAYRGLLSDWNAAVWIDRAVYFNAFVPTDSARAAFRALSSTTGENVLGVLTAGPKLAIRFEPKLLEKQIDGVFDTDGRLLYSRPHKKIIYLYTYRNEYLVMDKDLSGRTSGRTIDTTTRANISVARIRSSNTAKLSSPARVVNKYAATDESRLYVSAALIGRYEPRNMWDQASIIDAYDFTENRYLFSFYLYDKGGIKVSEFVVEGGRLYALAGNTVTLYKLDSTAFQRNH